ncbi:hypothetical protein [Ruicaihuangia caeni]|uniref:Transposase DDE domain-containing protein n=1 Tax=Ruicaihuangia caeni TaxID=3042517 RepID=A0AAW6T6W9_9MICO|nr:hypothetical protein [Klugiella sp. YN-L-19]MDI2099532.1 hypothetical protein [Klugiella sp. YN-L-19]
MTIGVGACLAAGYGMALLLAGYGIDLLARRATAALEGRGRGGFVYHADHDAWLCPEDQWLWPKSYDPENRVMRYRGTPAVCNSCPVKDACTASDDGREMVRAVDAWPATETARFYRGIACAIATMGVIWPAATTFAAESAAEVLVLLGVAAAIGLGSLPLWSHLRRSPALFPEHVPQRSLDESLADRQLVITAVNSRRPKYGSDTRRGPDGN